MSFGNPLVDELSGYMKTRIVLSAAELDFFTKLDGKPSSARELAQSLGIDAHATARVLDCLVVFDLLKKDGGRYSLTERGAVLSMRHPETMLPMLLHMNNMWDNWSKLTATVRNGRNPDLQPVVGTTNEKVTRDFIGAMQVIGRKLAHEIAATCDLKQYQRLLDIGGGSGIYTIAFLEQNPQMKAVIFDLAHVLPIAEGWIDKAGLRDRVWFTAGDFYKDELPGGSDCALLSAIIHQNSPDENIDLFKKIYRSLDPGGCLFIRDHIMEESRTKPPAGALFAINMLVHTRGGDTYTFEEVRAQLEKAGFTEIKLLRSGERMDCVVSARKGK